MAEYVRGMGHTLSMITGQAIDALDFDDDRLTHLLNNLSDKEIWQALECELSQRSIEVYELPTDVVRCDPTTVSGGSSPLKLAVLMRIYMKMEDNLENKRNSAWLHQAERAV